MRYATLLTTLVLLAGPVSLPAQDSNSPFVPLFNGKNLDGWYGNNPHTTNKIKDEQKRKEQYEKDQAETSKHWTVEDGAIVNDGFGPYLTTLREFGDIELTVDYKTVAKADSGIYLRGSPQVQIWDYTEEGGKWNIGADKGSGGLFNNKSGLGKNPLVLADKPFGQWNSFKIQQVGARTSVWLNGKLVVDHVPMENFWNAALPLPARGPIHLQTHGGEIQWKNITVRELSAEQANQVLREKEADGFQSVFNGKDLTGWEGALDNYVVNDGAIMCKPQKGGNLYTAEKYGDFVARLEFKLPPGGNNGLAIRYPGQGNPAYQGMCELQVLDSEHPKYAKLDDRQYHGSAYGMVAAHRGYLREAGQWNFQEVTVKGSTVKVELNGTVILDCDLSQVNEYMSNSPHPGKDLKEGYFGFAGHSDPVQFRNILIKRLD